jgi:rod shape-determining protein MreC
MRFIYSKGFFIFFISVCFVFVITFLHHYGWLNVVERGIIYIPRPINYLVSKTVRPFKSFFSTIYDLRQIVKDNQVLKQKIYALQNQQVSYDQLKLENDQLKKELKFVKNEKHQLIPCSVIGKNPTGIIDSVVIDCGTSEGAEEGLAVSSLGFLVGRITYTNEGFSAVQLITNTNFSTDAKISETGHLGVVRGSFNSGLIIDQVSQQENLKKGQLIITAGVNEKIPKNLAIGEVGEIITGQNELFKKATLLSPVDFGSLNFVFVVK